jgi:hypothetical protein
MPERVRAFVGVLTTLVFLAIGMMLLGEGQTGWASVLLALGAFRGAVVAKQLVDLYGAREEPPAAP